MWTSSFLVLSLLLGALRCPLCTADYSLNTYSDPQCTIPSNVLPSMLNTQVGVTVNNSACVPASSFPQAWIPTPGTPQWVGYVCSLSPVPGPYLDVCTFDYSTSDGQCPFNASDPYTCNVANASLIVFPSRPFCKLVQYSVYNVSLGQLTTVSLYGNFSCTTEASTPSKSAATHLASLSDTVTAALATMLLAVLL